MVGGGARMAADIAAKNVEVQSLHHQLSTCRDKCASADKLANERRAQCEHLEEQMAACAQQRDEQAELAAGAVAEAETLRRQLQGARTACQAALDDKAEGKMLLVAATREQSEELTATVTSLARELQALEARELRTLERLATASATSSSTLQASATSRRGGGDRVRPRANGLS